MRKAAAKRRSRSADEAPVRERLLNAVGELMAERDSIDVTIAEIAARASANVALVSYYFGGRDGLLLALAKQDADDALNRLEKLMRSDYGPEDKLRKHIVGVVMTFFRRPYLNRLLHALIRNTNLAVAVQVSNFFVRPLAEARKRILNEGIERGVFREIDPMLAHCMIDGACAQLFASQTQLQVVFGIERIDEELSRRHAETVADLIIRGLSSDGPR
jgi:TetR/AcrR family transcriptional regulator